MVFDEGGVTAGEAFALAMAVESEPKMADADVQRAGGGSI